MKDFKAIWKSSSEHTIYDIVNLCIFKAMNAKSNADKVVIAKALIAKSFTPITNKNKLENGCTPYSAFRSARFSLGWYTKIRKDFNQNLHINKVLETEAEFKDYCDILDALKDVKDSELSRKYCYVFVDTASVSPEQAMVQAAHVTMVVGKTLKKTDDPHNIHYQIVTRPDYLSAIDLEKAHPSYKFYHFTEPDLGNKIIASAISPIPWHKRRNLIAYPLVTFSKVA